ncbi:hypothetical protein [Flavobacterium sp. RSSB_23]
MKVSLFYFIVFIVVLGQGVNCYSQEKSVNDILPVKKQNTYSND